MIAVSPSLIPRIDAYATDILGIPERELMRRAGEAVAEEIAKRLPKGSTVLFYCGGGNNGGDGYAAALSLHRLGYRALSVDLFGLAQRTEAGRSFLEAYRAEVGEPLTAEEAEGTEADCLVDALYGTGGRLPLPPAAIPVAKRFAKSRALRVAIDIPLGVNGENGEVAPTVAPADLTVCLSYPKYGLYSYPAKEFVGTVVSNDLGLPQEALSEHFSLTDTLSDDALLNQAFPPRDQNTHKGSFGHLLLLSGSPAYRGASILSSLSACALRMGSGLVTLASCQAVTDAVLPAVPEVITKAILPLEEEKSDTLLSLAEKKTAILIGPGCTASRALMHHIYAFLDTEGAPLILDADALNSLSLDRAESMKRLICSKRQVIFTPHPQEFARMTGFDTKEVQAKRLSLARGFAKKIPGVLILKGAATLVCEGERFLINTTGSPALSKGGSGDVLAGAVAALVGQGVSPFTAAAAAAYLHGLAADRLSSLYSEYGVRPLDLPSEMAKLLAAGIREGEKR